MESFCTKVNGWSLAELQDASRLLIYLQGCVKGCREETVCSPCLSQAAGGRVERIHIPIQPHYFYPG